MVIRKEISRDQITDRAEGVLSALLNRKSSQTDSETEKPISYGIEWRHWFGLVYFISGLLAITIAILTLVYPLTNIIMDMRLEMTPGLPAFDMWYKPKPEIILNVYVFNVTNSYEFEHGIDAKLKVVEVGPIVYREILTHSDVAFHNENSTMSYTVERSIEFVPERNTPGILNQTIIIPNIPLLGMASFLQDFMFTFKIGFNLVSRSDSIFLNVSINNYLWNLSTPALATADKYASFITPLNNSAPLAIVYKNFKDRVNINIGKAHGYQDFFKINTFNYNPTVPGFNPSPSNDYKHCFASLMNSTEGAVYGQSIRKNDTLYYWRKTACRPIPLYFQEEIQIGKILGYKFITKPDMYDRTLDSRTDCYGHLNKVNYPSGMSDASKCYMGLPVTISLPHFYGRNSFWNDKVEGYLPDKEKHTSYAIIEPVTGIPLDQCARSQSNLMIPKLTGFNSKLIKFNNMAIPMIWLEYHLEKLTPSLDFMLYFIANFLPIGQYFIVAGILLIGIYFVISAVRLFEFGNRFTIANTNMIYTFDNEVNP